MNKYIISYEEYTEYNQVEGYWNWVVREFESIRNARQYLFKLNNACDIRKLKLSKVIDE